MQPEDRKQMTEDGSVVAAAPRHLYSRAASRHTKPLSSDEATSHSTRLSKDDSQVAGYVLCPLMNPLAIRLGWQTTPAKSLVMSSERGSTLIISLIILILLMLLGVTAMKSSDTQFQLTGNLQFEDSAMNNTETAINAAETALLTSAIALLDPAFTTARDFTNPAVLAAGPTTDQRGLGGLYPISSGIDPFTLNWTGTGTNGINYAAQVTASQSYIIELMSQNNRLVGSNQVIGGRVSSGCNQVNTYRITARGTSARGATKFVQSFYSVLSC